MDPSFLVLGLQGLHCVPQQRFPGMEGQHPKAVLSGLTVEAASTLQLHLRGFLCKNGLFLVCLENMSFQIERPLQSGAVKVWEMEGKVGRWMDSYMER